MERKKKEMHVAPCIRRLDHMMARNMDNHARALGYDEVTFMHGWILRYLYENRGKDIFQKDIEKQFGIGRSTVTNIIQLMEKKEYLQREAVEQDARLKKLILSEKGVEMHENMEHLVEQLNKDTLEGITDDELDIFFRVLDKLEENIMHQKNRLQEKEEFSCIGEYYKKLKNSRSRL